MISSFIAANRRVSVTYIFVLTTEHLVVALQLGMGSAVETLCGQAYGAQKYDMLGIYLQRSAVLL